MRRAADGQVRSAQIKTIQGIYSRPATKIAVLDVKNKDDDNAKQEPNSTPAPVYHQSELPSNENVVRTEPQAKPHKSESNRKSNDKIHKLIPRIESKAIAKLKYPKIKDICIINHHREAYAHEELELPTTSRVMKGRKPTEKEWVKTLPKDAIVNQEKILKDP